MYVSAGDDRAVEGSVSSVLRLLSAARAALAEPLAHTRCAHPLRPAPPSGLHTPSSTHIQPLAPIMERMEGMLYYLYYKIAWCGVVWCMLTEENVTILH